MVSRVISGVGGHDRDRERYRSDDKGAKAEAHAIEDYPFPIACEEIVEFSRENPGTATRSANPFDGSLPDFRFDRVPHRVREPPFYRTPLSSLFRPLSCERISETRERNHRGHDPNAFAVGGHSITRAYAASSSEISSDRKLPNAIRLSGSSTRRRFREPIPRTRIPKPPRLCRANNARRLSSRRDTWIDAFA